ncbi:alpha/beta hydrolase [Curvibacter sp. APW13]|uniref:alpha/beta hydrolase n=1 Tax=Curvibacter sp. APW13 TaxID=3077236 RepID=UPI0028E0419E|nr:alpha/beta hydrolase [Curvibacter sp. APW13]MDT8992951.1 alpha/beta hydrolase [Curvibacter sp. APW13]
MQVLNRRTVLALLALGAATPALAQEGTGATRIGVVLMHGKGGSPTGLVAELATYLVAQGMRVRNLEMPWSQRRQYDASPEQAQQQVAQALAELRAQGAQRVVLVGHSQGAVFALHLAAQLPVDGVVAIAPGGNTATELYGQKLGAYLDKARTLVAAGQGAEIGGFADYEGSKGLSTVQTRADWYAAWFDPQGAMAQERALRAVPATVPVLYLAPTGDYPALRRANPALFALLPPNARSRFEQPDASHMQAPTAARERIAQWLLDAGAP